MFQLGNNRRIILYSRLCPKIGGDLGCYRLLHLLKGDSQFRAACDLLRSFTVLRLIFLIQPEISHIHINGFGDSIYRSPAGILPHGMGTTII